MNDDLPHLLPHELRGARAAVATKHDEAATIARARARALARALGGPTGLRLQTAAVDTDTLGTFTGETPRPGTPSQSACQVGFDAQPGSADPGTCPRCNP